MIIFQQLQRLGGASLLLLASSHSWAAQEYKPFVLAAKSQSDMATVVAETKQKLNDGGFEIVGEYSPYAGADIVIVTNPTLKANAAASKLGAYGAGQRVAITRVGDTTQVTFTNPIYMAHAYRMKGDLTAVRSQLASLLGDQGEFGTSVAKSSDALRDYHYKIFMPYFDDQIKLAVHKDYDTAIAAVEAALAAGKHGARKVYRIDVPGKQESVFGVSLKSSGPDNKALGEDYVMSEIDFENVRSTAHLPYELVVSGQTVYTLSAKFRIAINFPDLAMMGEHSFMNIMDTPDAIQASLEQTAENK